MTSLESDFKFAVCKNLTAFLCTLSIVNYIQFGIYLVIRGKKNKIHGPITHLEHWYYFI